MFLSISTYEEDPEALEEGVRHVREEVAPAMSGAEGLRAGFWAVDREHGERISVMVWDSPEAAAAAFPAIGAAITRAREAAGLGPQGSPSGVERFEVVASL